MQDRFGLIRWRIRSPDINSSTQTVFSAGNQQATLMLTDEASGVHEDQLVGRAGQLLTAMMKAIGLEAADAYIASHSAPLAEQITLIRPRLIVALGEMSAQYLLNTKSSLESLRNHIHHFNETPLMVTYHPAYLLRNPADKGKAFSDLQFILRSIKENAHGRLSTPTLEGIPAPSS